MSAAFPALPTVTMLMAKNCAFAVTCAVPPVYPVLVVVIVAVELVPAATPVTVTKPVPLIEICTRLEAIVLGVTEPIAGGGSSSVTLASSLSMSHR